VPLAPGLEFVAAPLESKLSPSAAPCPERARAPSRLSNEWFSIITTTM
jgi:hypothetical protein